MLLQKTHSEIKNEVDWKREWDGQIILNHKSSISGAVAVYFLNILHLYHVKLMMLWTSFKS